IVELIKDWVHLAFGTGEPCHFHKLCGRNVCLRNKQMLHDLVVCGEARQAFRGGELKPFGVVEGIAGGRGESAIPHKRRVEGGIDDCGSAALITGTLSLRSNYGVILNTDRHRLGIAKSSG